MAYGKIKADAIIYDNNGNDVEETVANIASKASLNSPAFTGTPTAPTAAAATNTTQIATTEFVTGAIADLSDSAPQTLDTLNELAAALGDDANFSTTVTNSLATKAPLASPNFTGIPVARGDGSSTDGQIQLNCSQNSHGVKIKSPPHSAGASYTLTLPNDTGTSGEALLTDGSGALSWGSGGVPATGGTFTGAVKLSEVFEKARITSTAVSGTVNFDLNEGSVVFSNVQASGDFTINLRGDANTTLNSLMDIGDVVTIAFIYETPSNLGYYNQGKLQIDGTTSNLSQFWINEPTGSVATGAFIVMTYTVIKYAANTFRVLGQTSEYES